MTYPRTSRLISYWLLRLTCCCRRATGLEVVVEHFRLSREDQIDPIVVAVEIWSEDLNRRPRALANRQHALPEVLRAAVAKIVASH